MDLVYGKSKHGKNGVTDHFGQQIQFLHFFSFKPKIIIPTANAPYPSTLARIMVSVE
jgi:hypothetical protein